MSRFFLAVAALVVVPSFGQGQDIGIPLGQKAPAAVVQTLDGKPFDLGSYVGKAPVLIEFWATWCGQCRELEPALVAAHRKYGGRVRFLGVAVSVNQSPARIKAYAARHGLTHELLFDADGSATDAYSVPTTSYVVVVDRTGKVVYTGVGGDQDIDAAVRKGLQ